MSTTKANATHVKLNTTRWVLVARRIKRLPVIVNHLDGDYKKQRYVAERVCLEVAKSNGSRHEQPFSQAILRASFHFLNNYICPSYQAIPRADLLASAMVRLQEHEYIRIDLRAETVLYVPY